jgi:hypothetical protein
MQRSVTSVFEDFYESSNALFLALNFVPFVLTPAAAPGLDA